MKKVLLTCLILFAGVFGVMAQGNKPGKKQEKTPAAIAQRMATRLMLDDATAAKFTPLYEQYLSELAACRKQPQEKVQRDGVKDSDAEIEARITARFDAQEKRLKIERKYFGEFKKVLTMRQLQSIYAQGTNRKMPRQKGDAAKQPARPRPNGNAPQGMR